MIQAILPAIIGLVSNVVDKAVPDKDMAEKLKAEITLEAMKANNAELEGAVKIITAEAQGQSVLQRTWRPALMVLFGIIIANNYIIYPYLRIFFPEAPVMDIPPDMWTLLHIGIGGYIFSRTGEQMLKTYKGK